MKLKVFDKEMKEKGEINLPKQFNEKIREDLIKKDVLVIRSNDRQPYGASPDAGKRSSAEISRRRHNYRGSYGHGISRVPRKIMSRRGTRMNWVGAFAPGTVGGRRAHAPKASKVWKKSINKKEARKALRSAISATIVKDLVEARGHIIPEQYPYLIDNEIENAEKTKEIKAILAKLGYNKEIERVGKPKIRAGKGKLRGRKYRKKTGLLIVVSDECKLMKAINNILGFEVVVVNNLSSKLLAPGAVPGRATLFTEKAVKKMEEENLFM